MIADQPQPLLNVIQLQIPVLLVLIAHIVLQDRHPDVHRMHVFLALTQMIVTLIPKIYVLLHPPLQPVSSVELTLIVSYQFRDACSLLIPVSDVSQILIAAGPLHDV